MSMYYSRLLHYQNILNYKDKNLVAEFLDSAVSMMYMYWLIHYMLDIDKNNPNKSQNLDHIFHSGKSTMILSIVNSVQLDMWDIQ